MPYIPKPHLLIVDDERSTLEALQLLFGADFRVETFTTAAESLEAMKTRTYAVALVDVLLPDINGVELLAALKTAWPLTEVIIITGAKDLDLAQRCYERGAYDFVAKPWDNDALLRAVRRGAEHYEAKRKLEILEKQLGERPEAEAPKQPERLPDSIREIERNAILDALSANNWNQVHSARKLGIHRNTLVKKMKLYKIPTIKRPKGLPG